MLEECLFMVKLQSFWMLKQLVCAVSILSAVGCNILSSVPAGINLYAPCILYIDQTYRYSPEYTFYIFSREIYLIIFIDILSSSSFILPQNVCFLMLAFLVHKIFTFYINGVLNCICPAPGPKG